MFKSYTVVGIATDKNGNTKVRYANNLNQRLKILARDGFTNLKFVCLPLSQTKVTLCEHMLTLPEFQNDRIMIEQELKRELNKNKKLSRKNSLFTGTAEQLLEAIK